MLFINNMRRGKYHIFLQARIHSTRLPGKVIIKIEGKSIIELIIERLKKVNCVDGIFLITGPYSENRLLVEEANRLDIGYFCGCEENLLDRYYNASLKFNSENIIRVTADCPLIDADLINKGISIFDENNNDILSVGRIKSYPHGLDFEIFNTKTLQNAWKDIFTSYADDQKFKNSFVSVDEYMLTNNKFTCYDLTNDVDLSQIRITLDYPEDLELIRQIYHELYKKGEYFGLKKILNCIKKNPDLLNINKKQAG